MLDVIKSVLAAFFGVQSEANRQRDFQAASPWMFIVVGIALAAVFVLIVAGVAWLAAQ
ncbi:DUF2970 domain-containing protein [Nitrincola alkalilacustris]|uniref:DUF2970 domain-containing protein n=1 Tax=Nitrincola alkalilacustris TaxID=1571224 RepID=UPI00124ED007|nr:DUF2970 domain-containing protein [Nitrincola alkalilacustris]